MLLLSEGDNDEAGVKSFIEGTVDTFGKFKLVTQFTHISTES